MMLENRFFLFFLAAVSLAFLFLLRPFWGAIFWAIAIAILFAPVNHWFLHRLGNRPVWASLCTLLCCVLIVVVPLMLLVVQVFQAAESLYQSLQEGDIELGDVYDAVFQAFPIIPDTLNRFDVEPEAVRENFTEFAMMASQYLAEEAFNFGGRTLGFLVSLALMLYLAFFIFRDGDRMLSLLTRALPLGDSRERRLFKKFAEVTRATIKGNLIVAMVQGALGGIMFAVLGIPAAILWGVLMAVLSLMPAIGAFLVWGPVAIYMFATGDWVSGTVLVAFGATVIGLADNVLRPILVGRDTKLPDYVVLISTLGGIVLLGINGLVIGPLLAALFLTTWDIFMRDFDQQAIT